MARVTLYRTVGRKYGNPTWKADFEAAVHPKTQAALKAVAGATAAAASAALTHRTRQLGAARPKGRVPVAAIPSRITVSKGDVSDYYVNLEAGSARRALYIEGAVGPLRTAVGKVAGWAKTGSHPGDAFGNHRRGGASRASKSYSRVRARRRRRRSWRLLRRR